MQAHPAANLFPLLVGAELDALAADIREHGQREPIIIHNGMILDGRNRWRVCEKVGIPPFTKEWDGNGTPEAFVISLNLHRRHLKESQRAMVGAKIANIERGQVGGGHERADVDISTSAAATMLNISRDSVTNARIVLREGSPEEIVSVESGEAAVSATARKIRARRPKKKKQTKVRTARGDAQRMNAALWKHLRDALDGLTSLPRPADVIPAAKAGNRGGLVDHKLIPALHWLKKFEHEWNKRGQT